MELVQDRLYTVSEVAELLRVSRVTVTNWIKDGKLEAVRLDIGSKKNTVRVPPDALRQIISSGKSERIAS